MSNKRTEKERRSLVFLYRYQTYRPDIRKIILSDHNRHDDWCSAPRKEIIEISSEESANHILKISKIYVY